MPPAICRRRGHCLFGTMRPSVTCGNNDDMTAIQQAAISSEVREFLQRHRGEGAFDKVCELVRECYPHLRDITFRLRDDPDVPDRDWCVIEIAVPLIEEAAERTARSRRYHERLVSEVALEFVPLFAL